MREIKTALCRYRSMRVMQQAVRKMAKTAQKFAKRTAAAIKMQVCPCHASAYRSHPLLLWSNWSDARCAILLIHATGKVQRAEVIHASIIRAVWVCRRWRGGSWRAVSSAGAWRSARLSRLLRWR